MDTPEHWTSIKRHFARTCSKSSVNSHMITEYAIIILELETRLNTAFNAFMDELELYQQHIPSPDVNIPEYFYRIRRMQEALEKYIGILGVYRNSIKQCDALYDTDSTASFDIINEECNSIN